MQHHIFAKFDDHERVLAGLVTKHGCDPAKWDLVAADFLALTGSSKSKHWFKRRAKTLNLDEAVSTMAFEYVTARLADLGMPQGRDLAACARINADLDDASHDERAIWTARNSPDSA